MASDLPPGAANGDDSPHDADADDGRGGGGGLGGGSDGEQRCDLCGAPMLEWHCRIICTFCGYQRDCSDP
jgi:hypothetical protein